jgi:hypothetical protein
MKEKPKALPPIPKSVRLPAGDVAVVRESGHQAKGTAGLFRWSERVIVIDSGLGRTAAWLTLYHEWVHAVLADAGVQVPHKLEEDICNSLGAALVYGKRNP